MGKEASKITIALVLVAASAFQKRSMMQTERHAIVLAEARIVTTPLQILLKCIQDQSCGLQNSAEKPLNAG